MSLSIVSWNVFGARWLDLSGEDSPRQERPVREERKRGLNDEILKIIEQHQPEVIAFQETVEYSLSGFWGDRTTLIDTPNGYQYYSSILVDSIGNPQSNKWKNARTKGRWPTSALFSQGNAFLVREDLSFFPPSSLPKTGVNFSEWLQSFLPGIDCTASLSSCIQNVNLGSGIYFGDRDTEPRGCSILHLVFPFHRTYQQDKPLDVFILNTHLTTLLAERTTASEGGGKETVKQVIALRKSQMTQILDNVVFRYENWIQSGFKVRGRPVKLNSCETVERWAPLWVILGDFNFTQNSEEYNWFVNQGMSHLPYQEKPDTISEKFSYSPQSIVDHVFIRPTLESANFVQKLNFSGFTSSIETKEVSDHSPIFAKINISI